MNEMNQNKIIIGIGGNLHSSNGLHPIEIGRQAIKAITAMSINVEKQSNWYRSDPIPKSDQPKFFNSVIIAKTSLNELDVLKSLHKIEDNLGRHRKNRNEARVIDLDLIDYSSKILESENIKIPHPRAHLRRFVMEPLFEIEKNWVHPILKLNITDILSQLDKQEIELFLKSK
ncbi:2-amino-4-hydroxy-6-hydroxymethyldihydropteridine diphosphokinase [Alphaproteobacteria bacterium]|nr:2-amino-4-hydroxy-6-hydroxymethyldihydropteridine diphosphokinase [Alphaproteobacteria bacterium]